MEVIKGQFTYILYSDKQTAYKVVRFKIEDTEKQIIVTGYLDFIHEALYELSGEYIQHPKYGLQFKVLSFHRCVPTTRQQVIGYLSSSVFPGIGSKFAERLVDNYGEDVLFKIKSSELLLDDLDIKDKQKKVLLHGLSQLDGLEELLELFNISGISSNMVFRIKAKYEDLTLKVLQTNPYQLLDDNLNIGFKTADKIALHYEIPRDSEVRLVAFLIYNVINFCVEKGCTYMYLDDLEKGMYKQFETIDFEYILNQAIKQNKIYLEDNHVYHHSQFIAEEIIASKLNEFPIYSLPVIDNDTLETYLSSMEKDFNIKYDQKQRQAIFDYFTSDLSIITGGPGTGKTTIVQAIIVLSKLLYPDKQIALCAPTGRAAKRLDELTGNEAYTIHSLLRWDLETNTFQRNEKEGLTQDIIIIDEFSMVDNWLFSKLLLASENIKKIVIIGDEDQLPSVMPGKLLKDLIASQLFKTTKLELIYRQKDGSGVIEVSHKIKDDEVIDFNDYEDVSFLEVKSNDIKQVIGTIVSSALDKGYTLDDVQILAPVYDYTNGIDDINAYLQNYFNPAEPFKKEIKHGYRVFRDGDKILQLKNQIDDNVFNGEIGSIIDIDEQEKVIYVDFYGNIVSYSHDNFINITHAYCISIHKSQGSEYPIVIIPSISRHSYVLSKKLIYTAVSRAKKSLVLIGDKEVFLNSIKKIDKDTRQSDLLNKLLNQ